MPYAGRSQPSDMTRRSTTLKVLVSGGAGYLGSVLVGLLVEAGHQVRVIDCLIHGGQPLLSFWHHPRFEFAYGNICDVKFVRASLGGIDAVIHLAAIVGDLACSRDPAHALEVNLTASINLLRECRARGVERFIFTSTCSNYGSASSSGQFADERTQLRPLSVYAETKVAFENNILDSQNGSSLCATLLRLATLYGVSPRMRFDLTVNEFILKVLTCQHLVVFGQDAWRPYVHVRDAARAICEVLEARTANHVEVYNVGATSQNFRKRDLVEFVRIHAPTARIEYVPKNEEDLRNYRVSFEKIASELGFRANWTVQDGIVEVARLVKSNLINAGANAH